MITKFARLEFELFTKPSKLDFLRVHQCWVGIYFTGRIDILGKNIEHDLVDFQKSFSGNASSAKYLAQKRCSDGFTGPRRGSRNMVFVEKTILGCPSLWFRKFSINSGCIKKIPLNPPLQKGEGSGCPYLLRCYMISTYMDEFLIIILIVLISKNTGFVIMLTMEI
jgi:hypothetical protein